jgi:hypothetical protein
MHDRCVSNWWHVVPAFGVKTLPSGGLLTPTVTVTAAAALCRFPRRLITLCVDGVAILIGSLLGTSPLTVVAESSVGIKEGGRTGAGHCQATAPTSSQHCANSKLHGSQHSALTAAQQQLLHCCGGTAVSELSS